MLNRIIHTFIFIIAILIILIATTNISSWLFNSEKNYDSVVKRGCNTSCKQCMPKECKELFNTYQKSKINELYFLMVVGVILLCFGITIINVSCICKSVIYGVGFSGVMLLICSATKYLQIKNDYID